MDGNTIVAISHPLILGRGVEGYSQFGTLGGGDFRRVEGLWREVFFVRCQRYFSIICFCLAL